MSCGRKERTKNDSQVQKTVDTDRGVPKFILLVSGDWGNEVDKFLDEMSKNSVDTE